MTDLPTSREFLLTVPCKNQTDVSGDGVRGFGFFWISECQLCLRDRCNILHLLAEFGIQHDAVPRLGQKAFPDIATSTDPRPAKASNVAALIEQALNKAH